MSLALIVSLNAALDVVLLTGLALLLSRPSRLTPHEPAILSLATHRRPGRERAHREPNRSVRASRVAA